MVRPPHRPPVAGLDEPARNRPRQAGRRNALVPSALRMIADLFDEMGDGGRRAAPAARERPAAARRSARWPSTLPNHVAIAGMQFGEPRPRRAARGAPSAKSRAPAASRAGRCPRVPRSRPRRGRNRPPPPRGPPPRAVSDRGSVRAWYGHSSPESSPWEFAPAKLQDHPTLRHRRAQAASWRILRLRTCGIVGLTRRRPVGKTVATPRIGGGPSRAVSGGCSWRNSQRNRKAAPRPPVPAQPTLRPSAPFHGPDYCPGIVACRSDSRASNPSGSPRCSAAPSPHPARSPPALRSRPDPPQASATFSRRRAGLRVDDHRDRRHGCPPRRAVNGGCAPDAAGGGIIGTSMTAIDTCEERRR